MADIGLRSGQVAPGVYRSNGLFVRRLAANKWQVEDAAGNRLSQADHKTLWSARGGAHYIAQRLAQKAAS